METIINGKKVLFNANFVGGIYSDENALEFDLPKIQSIVYNYNELVEQDIMDLHEALLDVWFDNEGKVPTEWKEQVAYRDGDCIVIVAGTSIDSISTLITTGHRPVNDEHFNYFTTLITL